MAPGVRRPLPGSGTADHIDDFNLTDLQETHFSSQALDMKMTLSGTHRVLVGIAAVLMIAGCGGVDGPELADVSGKVTLNGQALPNAVVQFQPTTPQGSYSAARTDENGFYVLRFTRDQSGAIIGTHRVSISTAAPDAEDEDGNPRPVPEKVPAAYNAQSTLIRDVQPGTNTIDLALTGEIGAAATTRTRR